MMREGRRGKRAGGMGRGVRRTRGGVLEEWALRGFVGGLKTDVSTAEPPAGA